MFEEDSPEEYEAASRFLEMVFGPQPDETDPAVLRNPGCKFTEKVVDYLYQEWEIDLVDYSHDVQNRAIDMVDMMRARGENIPNTAGKVSMEVIPL